MVGLGAGSRLDLAEAGVLSPFPLIETSLPILVELVVDRSIVHTPPHKSKEPPDQGAFEIFVGRVDL